MGFFRDLADALLDLLYPPCCAACGEVLVFGKDEPVCGTCAALLPAAPERACAMCGRENRAANDICGDCAGEEYAFARCFTLYPYTEEVSRMILRYKAGGHAAAAKGIARLLHERFPAEALPPVDTILPVPGHAHKTRERGYSQTALIAMGYAALCGVRYDGETLYAARETRKQSSLNAEERRANVRGAYAVRNPAAVAGKVVLVLDDVFTTGATMDACARVVMEAGARAVYCMAVAASLRE